MTPSRPPVVALVLLASIAPFGPVAATRAQDVGSVQQPAILGNDDRQQWFEAGSLQSVIQSSTVMLVSAASVSSGTEVRTRTTRSDRAGGLCPDEAYACEEALGSCSGTLIDGHTIVTAGHCLPSLGAIRAGASCSDTAVVFNWRMESSGNRAQVLRARDVYYCHEVLAAHYRAGTMEPDFAIFTIKRDRNGRTATPVSSPYRPVAISTARRSSGRILTVGHPTGIPVKVSPGSISQSTTLRFASDADLFPGNSGGGTFFGSTLIGVATNAPDGNAGARDFYPLDGSAGCRREVRILSGRYNSHVWLAPMIDALCDPSHPHHLTTRPTHLCGTAAPVAPGPGSTTPPPSSGLPATCAAGAGAPHHAGLFLLVLVGLVRRRDLRAPRRVPTSLLVGLLAFAVACSAGTNEVTTDAATRDAVAPTEPVDQRYATAVLLASSTRREVGFDLDGDGDVDSAFGTLVDAASALGLDLGTWINDTLALGEHAQLVRFTTRDDRGTLTLRPGAAVGAADFSGFGIFRVSETEPERLEGEVVGLDPLAFTAEAERLRLYFPMGDALVAIPLVRARVEAELPIDEAVLNLGGALPERDLVTLVDTLAARVDAALAASPGCPSACEDLGLAMLVESLDADADGAIAGAELRTHPMLGPLLAPDLDLDADGRPDHFSFGVLAFLRRADFDEVASASLVAKADFCDVRCDARDCRSCQSSACGWCEGQGCMPRSMARECDAESWVDNQVLCPSCDYGDQGSCDRDGFCGWSTTCGRCVNDSRCSTIPTECTDLRRARGC